MLKSQLHPSVGTLQASILEVKSVCLLSGVTPEMQSCLSYSYACRWPGVETLTSST